MKKLNFLLFAFLLCAWSVNLQAQNSWTGTASQGFVAGPVTGGSFGPGNVNFDCYGSQADFDAALSQCTNPINEDFENTLLGPNDVAVHPGPLNSLTNDACYAPGAIQAGVTLEVIDNAGNSDYVVATTGFVGVPDVVAAPNTFANDSRFIFDTPVEGVNFEVSSPFSAGGATFDIEVIGTNGSLGTTTVTTDGSNTPTFIGIVTAPGQNIVQLDITSAADDGELYHSINTCEMANPVPTMSQWGLFLFALLMVNLGLVFMYRQERTLNLA